MGALYDRMLRLTGLDVTRCAKCGGALRSRPLARPQPKDTRPPISLVVGTWSLFPRLGACVGPQGRLHVRSAVAVAVSLRD